MALTPEDVVDKRFQATKFREGYDQDEVDDFLDEVVNELRRLNDENGELRQKLSSCEQRVGELSRAAAGQEVAVAGSGATVAADGASKVSGTAGTAGAVAASAPPANQAEAAAGMLALAQKLHDEYVRNGEQERDRLVNEAREHAARLKREADERQKQTLGALEQDRTMLERAIDELRGFEKEYRSRLKAYLESQLADLDAKAVVVPSRQQPAAAGAGAATGGQSASSGGRANSKG